MSKRLILSILILFLILLIAIFAIKTYSGGNDPDKENPIPAPPISKDPTDSSNDQPSRTEALAKEIFSISTEGKVAHIPFVSGMTDWQEVKKQWGKSDRISVTAKGRYEEYENHHAVIGYTGEKVSDIRSYDADLQKISLNEIKKAGGEPDEVRYYKDTTHDQVILVYHVAKSIELSWILPKSSEKEPNPKVDHISVYTHIEKTPTTPSITEEVSGMTLDEKIGQMILAGISGTTVDQNTRKLITDYKVGGIIFFKNNLVNTTQAVQLVKQIKSENTPNLPLFLSVDQEGGRVTRLPGSLDDIPTNQQIGALNNQAYSFKVGEKLGRELKAFGMNLNFAPVLDINSNPNNPVIGDRSFGDNAELVSNLGVQTMKGIQSQNIISTIKHFPGHGDTGVDSHLELPVVNKSLKELQELELIPFERAIANGADVVMVAHILLPKVDANHPASMSKTIMTDVLRNQLGFNGVVITDDMTMKAITNHYDIGQAAVVSVKSGSDIILVGHDYNNVVKTALALKTAVQKGEISQQRINESVARIITLKRKYGI